MIQEQYDPEQHHRRSIRLPGYDYTQPGAYFVTICTQSRACLFGVVSDGAMQWTKPGQIAQAAWDTLPARFPSIRLDAFIVMPNHVHGIIMVGEMVRAYKAASTRFLRQAGASDFAWQRNYYEHVVRDEHSLNRIRQYILDNPARWQFDHDNPGATAPEPEDAWRA